MNHPPSKLDHQTGNSAEQVPWRLYIAISRQYRGELNSFNYHGCGSIRLSCKEHTVNTGVQKLRCIILLL